MTPSACARLEPRAKLQSKFAPIGQFRAYLELGFWSLELPRPLSLESLPSLCQTATLHPSSIGRGPRVKNPLPFRCHKARASRRQLCNALQYGPSTSSSLDLRTSAFESCNRRSARPRPRCLP